MASALSIYDQFFSIRRFPPGRLFTVLLAMRQLAERERLAELIARIDEGLAFVKKYVALRRRRQNRRLGRGGGKAQKTDRIIDDDIAEIAHIAGKEALRFPNTDAGRAAQALVDAFFTQGIAPITQIPYDEELAVVEHMIPVMRRDHADALRLLGLERFVTRIEAHLPEYRAALAPTTDVAPGELAEAYEAMQVAFVQILGWVLVMIGDAELRDELLVAMRTHDAQLAAVHAARRRGNSADADVPPEDVAVDGLDLDAEAIDELAAAERADAEARAAAEAEAVDTSPPAAPEPVAEAPVGGDTSTLRPLNPPSGDR